MSLMRRRVAGRRRACRCAVRSTAMCCHRSICSPRQRVSERTTLSKDIIDGNAVALESVLADFGVRGEIINARPGPVVTLYELEPAPGIKSSRVIGLGRRHRTLDERGVGARRRRLRPQRHRHRIAQSDP